MKNLNYLMDHILYQMFKIISNISSKKNGEKTDNLSKRKYLNKIDNRITFKVRTGYDLKILTPQAMKILGSIKSKIIKDKMVEAYLI